MSQPFVRANVWSLPATDPIVMSYAAAVAAMQAKPANDPTSWAYQAAIHGTYASPPLPQWNQCRHGSWYFVSWHRMYVFYFERIVRAQVIANGGPSDWALPYWDYDGGGTENTLPLAFREPMSAAGKANSLYVAERNAGINSGAGLPQSITTPAFALGRPVFTGASQFGGGITSALGQFFSQTGRLEQTPHNDVHVSIGGLMGDPDTAAQDPIFWLHHANIDRLWWFWQQQYSDPTDGAWTSQSFEYADSGGVRASLTDADVLDTVGSLNYTYDHGPVGIPWPPKRKVRPDVKWPWPWPEPTRTPPGDADADADPARNMVGASEEPVRLVGDSVRVPVRVDARVMESLSALGLRLQGRAFLDLDDIEAEQNPGVVYGVYVNLPEQPTDDWSAHHVGNVSLFGVERARNPRGDEPAHGLHLSMEITELLDSLSADGSWRDGELISATFRPITLTPPTGEAALARRDDVRASTDPPITVGRVSIHLA